MLLKANPINECGLNNPLLGRSISCVYAIGELSDLEMRRDDVFPVSALHLWSGDNKDKHPLLVHTHAVGGT